jgi:20S proteasome alpha/beta subunit
MISFIYVILSLCSFFTVINSSIVVASRCLDGMIIGCDSLSPSGSYYISNRVSNKIFQINPHVILCDVSGDADVKILRDELEKINRQHFLLDGNHLTIRQMSSISRLIINQKLRSAHILLIGLGDRQKEEFQSIEDSPNERNISLEYELHEILPQGTRIVHRHNVVAGEGSNSVIPLMSVLFNDDSNSIQNEASNNEKNEQIIIKHVNLILKSAAETSLKTGGKRQLFKFSKGRLRRIKSKHNNNL